MTTKPNRQPTPAALSRALTVLARHGIAAIPAADLKVIRAQAAAAPPVDNLDRDLRAMTRRR